jgi:hypothetical protein
MSKRFERLIAGKCGKVPLDEFVLEVAAELSLFDPDQGDIAMLLDCWQHESPVQTGNLVLNPVARLCKGFGESREERSRISTFPLDTS